MSKIDREGTSLSPSAKVTLFIIDGSRVGSGVSYWTNAGQDVYFGGQLYQHISARFSGFGIREMGNKTSPSVQLVPNVWLNAFIAQFDDGRGAYFNKMVTYRRYLDDGDDPDPTMTYPPEFYYIERLTRKDESVIEWELSAISDLEGLSFPIRRVLSDHCDYSYRTRNESNTAWIMGTCPYSGTAMWNRNDVSTSDAYADHCANKLTGCKLRFAPAPLPFRGYPGVGRIQ